MKLKQEIATLQQAHSKQLRLLNIHLQAEIIIVTEPVQESYSMEIIVRFLKFHLCLFGRLRVATITTLVPSKKVGNNNFYS